MRTVLLARLTLASLVLVAGQAAAAPLNAVVADYEAGLGAIFQNDSRYGANGTSFDAADVAQTDNVYPVQRISLQLRLAENHEVRATYIPVDLTTRTTLAKEINFNDVVFASGSVVDFRYLFDGTRLTYLYHLVDNARWSFAAGGLFQLRNARVAISDVAGTKQAAESDVGPVGAIALMARHTRDNGVYGQLDAAGFSTFGFPNGLLGAVWDVALTLGVPLGPRADLCFRLRYYGGGADVPSADLKNWGQFGFATLALRLRLDRLAEG